MPRGKGSAFWMVVNKLGAFATGSAVITGAVLVPLGARSAVESITIYTGHCFIVVMRCPSVSVRAGSTSNHPGIPGPRSAA